MFPTLTGMVGLRRILIPLVPLSLAGFHVLSTVMYLAPRNLFHDSMGEVSYYYINSFFYQNWHLFSPSPRVTTLRMPIRYQHASGEWSEWYDPIEDIQNTFYLRRLSGVGKLVSIYRHTYDVVREELSDVVDRVGQEFPESGEEELRDKIFSRMGETEELELAYAYALKFARKEAEESEIKAVQFKLIEFFPENFSENEKDIHTWGKMSELEFPAREASAVQFPRDYQQTS